MGGRANHIHNIDNDNGAVEHNFSAGFAVGHEHDALSSERNIDHGQSQRDHTERFLDEQLPCRNGPIDQRERYWFDEHHDIDSEHFDEYHDTEFG